MKEPNKSLHSRTARNSLSEQWKILTKFFEEEDAMEILMG